RETEAVQKAARQQVDGIAERWQVRARVVEREQPWGRVRRDPHVPQKAETHHRRSEGHEATRSVTAGERPESRAEEHDEDPLWDGREAGRRGAEPDGALHE